MRRFRPAGALLAALIFWGCAPSNAEQPPPPPPVDAPAPAPEPPPEPAKPPTGFVPGELPADAAPRLRHDVSTPRQLAYAGIVKEEVLARMRGEIGPVSSKTYRTDRIDLVLPAGGELARVHSHFQGGLTAATSAGRDRLDELRDRPSGGIRSTATARRLSSRGLEPAGGDRSLYRSITPLPEMPRFPAGKLTAKEPLVREQAGYEISWRLAGAGRLGERDCWQVTREVKLKEGAAPPGARKISGRDEFLIDRASGTVLTAVGSWNVEADGLVRSTSRSLWLVEELKPAEKELTEAAGRMERLREMLRAVGARDAAEAERLAREFAEENYRGPAVQAAARFVAAEKQFTEAAAGWRRIDLVPEDTFVFIQAPEKLDPEKKLTPVVFFHGGGARPKTYFDDWRARTAGRGLLLIFPQSRDWTWSAQEDGAVVGSLLDVLGRAYNLDRSRLVLAGHAAGAEMAYAMAYGASFPGYDARGVVAAGGTVPGRIRELAAEGAAGREQLAARIAAVNVLILAGTKDENYPPEVMKNSSRWIKSFNPDGVEFHLTPELGWRYSADDWTPRILDWIGKLAPRKKAAGK